MFPLVTGLVHTQVDSSVSTRDIIHSFMRQTASGLKCVSSWNSYIQTFLLVLTLKVRNFSVEDSPSPI